MRGERGSTLPLIIGVSSLLLALTFALSETLSLRLAQDRAKADANFAVIYTLKQLGQIPPVIGLDYREVVVAEIPEALDLAVVSDDGKTLNVRLCEAWDSPLGLHSQAKVCDQASARLIG